MKAVTIAVAILVTVGVGYYCVSGGYRFVRNTTDIDGGVEGREWVDETTLKDIVTFESPFPFETNDDETSEEVKQMFPDFELQDSQGGSYTISCSAAILTPEARDALEVQPRESLKPGEVVAGFTAIEGYRDGRAKVMNSWAKEHFVIHEFNGFRFERRDVMFSYRDHACTLSLTGSEGDQRLPKLWQRLLASVRDSDQPKIAYDPDQSNSVESTTPEEQPQQAIQPGAPTLPSGMERRSFGPKE